MCCELPKVHGMFGFRMASVATHEEGSRLYELRRSGVVRSAAAPAVASRVLAQGDPLLRELLPGGGFPAGHIVELRGSASSGRLTLAVRILLRSVASSERAAFVASREFFPGLSPGLSGALDGVLVCRMRSLDDALGAAEVLASSGAVDLLVVDAIGLCPPTVTRANGSAIARIERSARTEGVAVVVLTDPTSAAAIGLGSKASIRLLTDCERIGTPDGCLRARVTLARSRFQAVSCDEDGARFGAVR